MDDRYELMLNKKHKQHWFDRTRNCSWVNAILLVNVKTLETHYFEQKKYSFVTLIPNKKICSIFVFLTYKKYDKYNGCQNGCCLYMFTM